MSVPESYWYYQSIAEELGTTLDVTTSPNTRQERFRLTHPFSGATLELNAPEMKKVLEFLGLCRAIDRGHEFVQGRIEAWATAPKAE